MCTPGWCRWIITAAGLTSYQCVFAGDARTGGHVSETLNQRVQNDLKQAMKDRDENRVRAIRMIRAAFIEASKEGAGEVSDERAFEALRRIRKQRVESAEQYRAGGRPELAADEEA